MEVTVRTSRLLTTVLSGAQRAYWQRVKALFDPAVVALWPHIEPSGTTAIDTGGNGCSGVYTDVLVANTASFVSGYAAPLINKNVGTSIINIQSTALANLFNGREGSFFTRIKANTGAWGTASIRHFFRLTADANNRMWLRKSSPVNQLEIYYTAGGVLSFQTINITPTTGWDLVGFTWSKTSGASGEVRAYLNGAQIGSTMTGLGLWAGAPVSAGIGGSPGESGYQWDGWLSMSLLLNKAATPTEVNMLYTENF